MATVQQVKKSPKMIWFFVPGNPVAKARSRTVRNKHTGKVHSFTPENTVIFENLVKTKAQEAMGGAEPITGALEVCINVGLSIPTTWSEKRRNEALRGEIAPTKKPDLDNVVKAIKDGMNAIVYRDDNQVVRVSASKHYTATPGVFVLVRKMEGTRAAP
jgi:Holliday junction resolvase RusA-like endonuclease